MTARSDRSVHSMFQLRHLGRSTWLLGLTADARLLDRSTRFTPTRQGNSSKLLLVGPRGPGRLGQAVGGLKDRLVRGVGGGQLADARLRHRSVFHLSEQRRHVPGGRRQTQTVLDARPLDCLGALLCCSRWFSPFVVFTKFPAEPCLLDHFSLVTCRVSSDPGGTSPDLSGSLRSPASPRHTSGQTQSSTSGVPLVPASNHGVRVPAESQARSCSRPLGLWPLGLSIVLCQTAHVEPVGPGADVSACSQSLTCAITLKARSSF